MNIAEVIWEEVEKKEEWKNLIEKVLHKCFEVECINPTSFYICITLTTPNNIQKLNKQYRNIDKPTDVLSFPMFEKQELDEIVENNSFTNIGQDILGDIIISIARVEEQAKEYGHSFERELAYMLVHGFYHLRGYDHMQEEEKIQMRKKEENVLSKLNITRDDV